FRMRKSRSTFDSDAKERGKLKFVLRITAVVFLVYIVFNWLFVEVSISFAWKRDFRHQKSMIERLGTEARIGSPLFHAERDYRCKSVRTSFEKYNDQATPNHYDLDLASSTHNGYVNLPQNSRPFLYWKRV